MRRILFESLTQPSFTEAQPGTEDSSIAETRGTGSVPTLRNFSTQNTVVLRDGQTMQFTAAADKTTGEVVKVDVTMTVEK